MDRQTDRQTDRQINDCSCMSMGLLQETCTRRMLVYTMHAGPGLLLARLSSLSLAVREKSERGLNRCHYY